MTQPADIDIPDIGAILEGLAAAAQANPDSPAPLAVGTFAMYPMEDGGVMCVTAVADGPMQGTHHHRLAPGLIRAVAAITGTGGGKMKALKGMFSRKAIGQ